MSGLNRFLMEEVELPLVEVLADLEDTGYAVDASYFQVLKAKLTAEQAELRSRLCEFAGPRFNPASRTQVAEFLYTRLGLQTTWKTEGGAPSTAESALAALVDQHETVPLILRDRTLSKVINTYCNLPDDLGPDGRFHTQFHQMGAETGRITSPSIIQTMPKDTSFALRRGFVAGPGRVIVAADYNQQELCVLAAVSGDEQLQTAVRDRLDLHGLAAVKVFGLNCKPDEVKSRFPKRREQVKAIQFGIVYGQGAPSLAEKLHITESEADQLLKDYFAQFPAVQTFITNVHRRVVADGYVDDLFGRRRYLPDARLNLSHKQRSQRTLADAKNFGRIQAAKRAAQNFVIQGASATITKWAMVRCHRHLREHHSDAKLILTLHDELQFEAPVAEAPQLAAALPRLMTDLDLPRFGFHVPLSIAVKTGPNWGDLSPFSCSESIDVPTTAHS